MALYVTTNVSSLNSQRKLSGATKSLDTTYQRLSSGLRINSAKDDAAGLQISNRLTNQINGLNIDVIFLINFLNFLNLLFGVEIVL